MDRAAFKVQSFVGRKMPTQNSPFPAALKTGRFHKRIRKQLITFHAHMSSKILIGMPGWKVGPNGAHLPDASLLQDPLSSKTVEGDWRKANKSMSSLVIIVGVLNFIQQHESQRVIPGLARNLGSTRDDDRHTKHHYPRKTHCFVNNHSTVDFARWRIKHCISII